MKYRYFFKRSIVLLAIGTLTITGLCSCANTDNNHISSQMVLPEIPDYESLSYNEDLSGLPKDVDTMDEIIRNMTTSAFNIEVPYTGSVPSFFWTLINQLMLDEMADRGNEVRDKSVYFTKEELYILGTAAFADVDFSDGLPEIPPDYLNIYYYQDTDEYSCPYSPMTSDIHTKITAYSLDTDGSCHLIVCLMHNDDPQAYFYVDLIPYDKEGYYPYRILNIQQK